MSLNPLPSVRTEIERLLDPRAPLNRSDAVALLDRAPTLSPAQRALVELIVTGQFPHDADLMTRVESLGNGALAPAQVASGLLQEANQVHFINQSLFRLYGATLEWLEARFEARGAAELVEHGRVHLGVLARLVAQARRGESTDAAEQARAESSVKKIQTLFGWWLGKPKKPLARMEVDLPWLAEELASFEPRSRTLEMAKTLRPTPQRLLTVAFVAASLGLAWLIIDLTNALKTMSKVGDRSRALVGTSGEAFQRPTLPRDVDPTVLEKFQADLADPVLLAKLQGDYPATPNWVLVASDNNEQPLAELLARIPGIQVLDRSTLRLNVRLPGASDWFAVRDLDWLSVPKPLAPARLFLVSCGPTGEESQSRITIRDARTLALVHACVGQSMSDEIALPATHYLNLAADVYLDGKGDGVLAELLLRLASSAAQTPAERAECGYVEAQWHALNSTPSSEAQAAQLFVRALPGLADPEKKVVAKKFIELKGKAGTTALPTWPREADNPKATPVSPASVSATAASSK